MFRGIFSQKNLFWLMYFLAVNHSRYSLSLAIESLLLVNLGKLKLTVLIHTLNI